MIPILAAGAVSLANNVIGAWQTHAENVAASRAVQNANFQETLKTAATQLASTSAQQSAQAIPGQFQSVARQIMQSRDFQSLAAHNLTGSMNLQFNSNGNLFAVQSGGALRQIAVAPSVQQQLQQLNSAMRQAGTGYNASPAPMSGEFAAPNLPVRVNLAAV